MVEFDHPVNINNASGNPKLKLETGNDNQSGQHGDYISGTGSHQLTFEYRVRDGDDTSAKPDGKLRYSGNDALQLNGSRIYYQEDNASIVLPDYSSPYSFSKETDLKLDTIPPKGISLHIKGGIIDGYSTNDEDVVTLSANDNFLINSYFLYDQGDVAPQSDNGSWVNITSTDNYSDNVSFTHLACPVKTGCPRQVFAWFRDNATNVSVVSVHDNTTLDTIRPILDNLSGLATKNGFPGTGPGPYKSGDNLSLSLSFSEPVFPSVPQVGTLVFSGVYSSSDNFTVDNMSASLIHSVQNNTGSQTITVSGLMDKAGNAIKDNITNGNRFIVDNTLPSLAFSLRDPHSPNIVGCSRTLSTLLNIDTGDAGDQMYIKSIYVDNSSLMPVTPTLDNISLQNYTNDNLTQGFGGCETGGNHLDLDNNSWPQQYYGCERTITVWVEDYAGNIKKVSDNISYDNVSAIITSVTSSNSDIRAGSYPHYGIGTPVTVNVLFSEPLEKIGNDSDPEIYLDTGFSSPRTAGYVSGTGTDNHSYSYTVTEGDNTTDLSLDNQTLGKQASYFEMSGCPVNLLTCLLYTSPSPRDAHESRMPSSA